MESYPGGTLMMHDPQGRKHKVTIVETHAVLKSNGEVDHTVTVRANRGGKRHTFNEGSNGVFFNWPEGWGLTYASPEPPPLRVGCTVEYKNTNSNVGQDATYVLEVLGMCQPQERDGDPYYGGKFACKVLKAKPHGYLWYKPWAKGDIVFRSVSDLRKIIKPGTGKELIPYRLYMTKKEQATIYRQARIY